jgi:DNA polymerase-3 subunit chi
VTRIDFYTHVEDKHQTACLLAGKALARGVRIMILTADSAATERLDKLLWTQPAIAFVPHCRAHHRLAAVTPVILDHVAEPVLHEQVLMNLSEECPPSFSRYERLIEIVTADEADRERARARFRFYRERGYEIHTHDLSQPAAST